MTRKIDTDLKDLKEIMLRMGGLVEAAIATVTQGLITRDLTALKQTHEYERQINKLHIEVDEACLNILALQAPLAADLRLILAIVKINSDLERMGDQSVNIAYSGEHYLSKPAVKSDVNLPAIAHQVKLMVTKALDAFVRGDINSAQQILKDDDIVDRYKSEAFQKLKAEMQQNPDLISSCLDMILITRNLERLADHATNIAEDVIFVYTGRDIRHGIGRQEGV